MYYQMKTYILISSYYTCDLMFSYELDCFTTITVSTVSEMEALLVSHLVIWFTLGDYLGQKFHTY